MGLRFTKNKKGLLAINLKVWGLNYMANAKISIDLDQTEAKDKLRQLANGFKTLDDAVDGVGDSSKAMSNKVKSNLDSVKTNLKSVESATGSLDKTIAKFGGMLLTMEMAKKVGAFVDKTLEAASANDKLSDSVRQSAKEYVEIKKNVGAVGEGLVLVSAQVATNMAKISGLSGFLKKEADFWSNGGIDQSVLDGLNKEIETTKARAKKASDERKQNEKDEADLKLKNEADRLAAIKRDREARLANLKAVADTVKANYGSEVDVIDRVYDRDLAKLNKTLKAKLISQSEYEDASAKLLEDRNKKVREAQRASETDNNTTGGYDGDAAKAAQLKAEEQAKVKLEAEKKYQSDLYTLRLTSANSETERLQLERERITQHYQELTNQYQSSAEMLVEIDKAKNKELADNSNKIAEIEQANRKASLDTFLNGYNSLFSHLANQNKKWAVAAKTVAVTQATVNTLEGVTKAYAQGGALGFITGAGVLASGLATVAQIKNQKFANGGIVEGSSYVGDYVPVRANSGEMILNQSQQAQLFKMANNQSVGNSSPVNLTINVSGSSAVDVKKMLFENRNELNKMVASALSNRNINSVGVLV